MATRDVAEGYGTFSPPSADMAFVMRAVEPTSEAAPDAFGLFWPNNSMDLSFSIDTQAFSCSSLAASVAAAPTCMHAGHSYYVTLRIVTADYELL